MLGSGSQPRQRHENSFALHTPRHFANVTRSQNSRRDVGDTKSGAPAQNADTTNGTPYFSSLSYPTQVV
jgi:hypothetical protein